MSALAAPETQNRVRAVREYATEGLPGSDPLPLADFATLREALREAIENDGLMPREAAHVVLSQYRPDEEATQYLLPIALGYVANSDIATRREGRPRPSAVVDLVPPEPIDVEDPLGIPAATVHGTMRPLFTWNIADWRAWSKYCETQTDGWFRRQEGARDIANLLEKHKAETVADLPPTVQEKVRVIVRGFRA